MIIAEEDYLAHYGILRKSGRYPWGSGETQSARNRTFLDTYNDLRRQGLSDTEIAKGFSTDEHPFNTAQLRAAKTIATNQQKQELTNQAQRLKDKGYSNVAIGERLGKNESTIRSLLAAGQKDKLDVLTATSDMLKRQVAEKGLIDIGRGVETGIPLGNAPIAISKEKLGAAVALLKEDGYTVHYIKVPTGPNKETTVKVLAAPGTKYSEVYANRGNIKQIQEFTEDGGRSYLGIQPPISINSKRVGINYAENGGDKADGVIYVRPGVKDVSIGAAQYAQVRIKVDDSHYIKGMAVYKNDLPAGTDLVFNTNKSNTGNKLDALKPLKDEEANPFGATVRQIMGPNGKVSSAMNIVGTKEGSGEEGSWDTWSRNLPAQMLSKQSPGLAKGQLNVTYERRRKEFDEIVGLTNPVVRKKLLETFADETDSAAVHLKAASIPRQATRVLMPVNSMKPGEIYAPSFRDGERVALVRFPHGGTFEIPQLTVNNKNREAKSLLGSAAKDAVGIHHSVAERLSGADFDGDTVLVIPNDKGLIKSTPALEGLKGFDPKRSHPPYDGMKTIDGGTWDAASGKVVFAKGQKPQGSTKQTQMGLVTNLIADMTIRGASDSEKARAIRHSMVVIDSEKHVLDYRGSEKANGIKQLKAKYQHDPNSPGLGASTLITRASSEKRVNARRLARASEGGPVDPITGKKNYVDTGETYVNRKGVLVRKTEVSKKLAETDDAFTLSSGTTIERVYAEHSNRLKSLANTARKEALSVKAPPRQPSSAKVYKAEVDSLDAQLRLARKNAPLERQAQIMTDAIVRQTRQANPNMDKADVKKVRTQALNEMRNRTGAGRHRIKISPTEWQAIQAGAISSSKLREILDKADMDSVRTLATPPKKLVMTSSKQARAKMMLANGFTQAEIADALGVSLTTLKVNLGGGGG